MSELKSKLLLLYIEMPSYKLIVGLLCIISKLRISIETISYDQGLFIWDSGSVFYNVQHAYDGYYLFSFH